MASNKFTIAQRPLEVKLPNPPKDGQASQEMQKQEMITGVNLQFIDAQDPHLPFKMIKVHTHTKKSTIADENVYRNRHQNKENMTPIDGRTVSRLQGISQVEFWAVWKTLENDPVCGEWRSGLTKPCVDCAAAATHCHFATSTDITCIPCQDIGLRCSVKARFGIFRVAQLLHVLPTWVENRIDKGWDLGPGLAGKMPHRSAIMALGPTFKVQKSSMAKKKIIHHTITSPPARSVIAFSPLQLPLRFNDIPQIPTISNSCSSGIKIGTTSAQLIKLRRQVAKLTEERDEFRARNERAQREALDVTARFKDMQKALNEALATKLQLDEEVAWVMEENRKVSEMCRRAGEQRDYWRREAGRRKADAEYYFAESRERGRRAFRADQRVRDLQRDQYHFRACVSAATDTILDHLDYIPPRSRWSTADYFNDAGTFIRQAPHVRSQQRMNFCHHDLPLPPHRLGDNYGH